MARNIRSTVVLTLALICASSVQGAQNNPSPDLDQSRFLERFDQTYQTQLGLNLMGRSLGLLDVEMSSTKLSLLPDELTQLIGIQHPSETLTSNLLRGFELSAESRQIICLDMCDQKPYGLKAVLDLTSMELIIQPSTKYVDYFTDWRVDQRKADYTFSEPSWYAKLEAGGVHSQSNSRALESGYLEAGLTRIEDNTGISFGRYRGLTEAYYRQDLADEGRLSIGVKRSEQPYQQDFTYIGVSYSNDEAIYAKRHSSLFRQPLLTQFFSAPASVQVFLDDQLLKSFRVGAGLQALPLDDLPSGAYQIRLVIREEGAREREQLLPYRRDFSAFEPVQDTSFQWEAGWVAQNKKLPSDFQEHSSGANGIYASTRVARRFSPSTVLSTQIGLRNSRLLTAAAAQFNTKRIMTQLDASANSGGGHAFSLSEFFRSSDQKSWLSARLGWSTSQGSSQANYDQSFALSAFRFLSDRLNLSVNLNYLDLAIGGRSFSKTARLGYQFAKKSRIKGAVSAEYSHVGDRGLRGDSFVGLNYTHVWRQPRGTIQATSRGFYEQDSGLIGRELELGVSKPNLVRDGVVNLDQYYSALISDSTDLGNPAYEAYGSLRNRNDFSDLQLSAQQSKCDYCNKGLNRQFSGSIDSGFAWSGDAFGWSDAQRDAALIIKNDTNVEIQARAGGRRVKVGARQAKSLPVNSYESYAFDWEAGGDTSDLIKVEGIRDQIRLRDQQAGRVRFTQSRLKYVGFTLVPELNKSMSRWSFEDDQGRFSGVLDRDAQAIISFESAEPVETLSLQVKDIRSSYSCQVQLNVGSAAQSQETYTYIGEHTCR